MDVQNTIGGSLQISTDVLAKIARLAALEVGGVAEVTTGNSQNVRSLLGRTGESRARREGDTGTATDSGLGAAILLPQGMLHPEVVRHARENGLNPVHEALLGGEDYALLGSCAPDMLPILHAAIPGFMSIGTITDDGELAHKMLSPKSHVYKQYRAQLDAPVEDADIQAFAAGVAWEGEQYAPARLWVEQDPRAAFVEIREGRFHQVKRMFQVRGKTVLQLKRLKIGGLWLDSTLQEGECRLLTPQEIQAIFH